MIGTVAGLIAVAVGLALVAVALWVLAGGWGLLGAGCIWAALGAVIVKPEVLYARTA